jgi:hypothetical protein
MPFVPYQQQKRAVAIFVNKALTFDGAVFPVFVSINTSASGNKDGQGAEEGYMVDFARKSQDGSVGHFSSSSRRGAPRRSHDDRKDEVVSTTTVVITGKNIGKKEIGKNERTNERRGKGEGGRGKGGGGGPTGRVAQ